MTTDDDIATVTRLLASDDSIPVQLRMRQGLDEEAYTELTGAIERLITHFASKPTVPKELALAFVDISNGFYYDEGAYPATELERIEDVGHELSQLAQLLFGNDD
jgi:hypothetical protein